MTSQNIWPRSGSAEVKPERANRRSVRKVITRTSPNSAGKSTEGSRIKMANRHKMARTGTRREPPTRFPHKNANRARFRKPRTIGSGQSGSSAFSLQENANPSPFSRNIPQTYAHTSVRTLVSVRYDYMSSSWHALARSNQRSLGRLGRANPTLPHKSKQRNQTTKGKTLWQSQSEKKPARAVHQAMSWTRGE